MQRLILMGCLSLMSLSTSAAEGPRFRRDVRPILANKCFRCHGLDAATRQANLRLDRREDATFVRETGAAIVAGNAAASPLIARINSREPTEQMPPPESGLSLTPAERETLARWIAAGAEYEPHWSFQPPARPAIPSTTQPAWQRNPIDAFVQQQLDGLGWSPAEEASREPLLRRLSLDLRGLPPSPDEVEAFVNDSSPMAYEAAGDRLLASPAHGERLALLWLDLARYADTGGYQGDIFRTMWPWRDWVIAAFNANMPYDEFSIAQLAGDLLPSPTFDQRLATGFHRNHRINDEDGIIHEEFRVEYVFDRAETTAAVWMGLTLLCARCHDHKYDPISQRDYYGLYAFFNSTTDSGRGHGNSPPLLSVLTPPITQQLQAIVARLQMARQHQRTAEEEDEQRGVVSALTAFKRADVGRLEQQHDAVVHQAPTTMVLQELPEPRPTFVLTRGAYDKPAEAVRPSVPAWMPLASQSPTRLDFARSLFDPRHPLTARVMVNRLWELHFGRGLVATLEDFGIQGELPTHPELLDWLAVEFIESGWNIQHLQRLIVTSATYRQSSAVDAERYARDPDNRWLARGARFRLPAELLRDQALAVSGLMTESLGGPSVRPYQPDGLWKELASNHLDYTHERNADLYRRSMYTFWRRTIPPPSMSVLDAPNREICTVRRARTNTPVQALVLMNDPTFVEAARALAERALLRVGLVSESVIDELIHTATIRPTSSQERAALADLWQRYRRQFEADPAAAERFLSVGERPRDPRWPVVDLAAYAAVAGLVLNLDEVLCRE